MRLNVKEKHKHTYTMSSLNGKVNSIPSSLEKKGEVNAFCGTNEERKKNKIKRRKLYYKHENGGVYYSRTQSIHESLYVCVFSLHTHNRMYIVYWVIPFVARMSTLWNVLNSTITSISFYICCHIAFLRSSQPLCVG